MRGWAVVVAIGLASAACGGDAAPPPETPETTGPAAPPTTEVPSHSGLSAEREAAIAAWTSRPLSQIVTDGFDTGSCVGERPPDDMIVDDAGVDGLGWAFLQLPLEVEELDSSGGGTPPAVVLNGDEVFPNPNYGYVPTHAWIGDPDTSMLALLTDTETSTASAEVLLGIGPTDQGLGGRAPERLAFASLAWILTDDAVIPFSGECEWVTAFKAEIGDPLTEIPILRSDAYRRAELVGLTGDEIDFAECQNPEPGLGKLVGFGGEDVGLAFGPWPTDAATFTDIDLDGWTVLPPAGQEAPAFAERGTDGFPNGDGLDPNGWLFTFTVEEDRAVVQTLFSTDPVLGLRVWTSVPSPEEPTCFEARQVIAFREFVENAVPDRPAWDLSPALPGGEQVVIETLELLRTDAQVRAKFRDWTPCTNKLCELNNEVER